MINNLSLKTLNHIKTSNMHYDKEKSIFLFDKNRVSYVYNVCKLEGNSMSFNEVKNFLNGSKNYKTEDEEQVLNQNNSLSLLIYLLKNNKFNLDKETFCKLNTIISNNESLNPGKFRYGNVSISGTNYIPPDANSLDELFNKGIEKILKIKNPIIRAFTFFGFGSINQFFWDGNKRTSRLLCNGILLENGYQVLNIKAKDKLKFDKNMINFYNSTNYKNLLNYLVNYYKLHIQIKQNFIIHNG